MASSTKTTSSLALFFFLNILFSSLVTAARSPPVPEPTPCPTPPPTASSPPPPTAGPSPPPAPTTSPPPPPTAGPSPPPPPTAGPPSPTTGNATCPRSGLGIQLCANVLNLVNITIGNPPVDGCCSLIRGLADLEAAVCLCTSIKASIPGLIKLDLPLYLRLLLNDCGRNVPENFECA